MSAAFRTTFPRLCAALFLLLTILSLAAPSQSLAAGAEPRIAEYRVVRSAVRDAAGRVFLAVRSFKEDGAARFLVFDPANFQSRVLPAAQLTPAGAAAESALAATPLLQALDRSSAAPYPLQNDGATRAEAAISGQCLTVDLCPSKRPFERELFETLSRRSGNTQPVPVAVAVTGLWISTHPDELAYLKAESATGRLAITWVNHSFHHPYDPQVPLARTFLLTPGTDFDAEVLEVEKLLLSRGLVPSPFFRFPGLVSDAATVKRLRELSLIPIGADAWLAKGETPKKGSFILVHGNGNEPKGIKLILPLLHRGELKLVPLSAAFGG